MVIEAFYFLFKGGTIFGGQPAEYGGLVSGIGLLVFCRLAHHYSWRGDDCINIMFLVLTGRFSLHLCPSNYFGAIPLG